jgi:hypothetical protein
LPIIGRIPLHWLFSKFKLGSGYTGFFFPDVSFGSFTERWLYVVLSSAVRLATSFGNLGGEVKDNLPMNVVSSFANFLLSFNVNAFGIYTWDPVGVRGDCGYPEAGLLAGHFIQFFWGKKIARARSLFVAEWPGLAWEYESHSRITSNTSTSSRILPAFCGYSHSTLVISSSSKRIGIDAITEFISILRENVNCAITKGSYSCTIIMNRVTTEYNKRINRYTF